MALLENEPYSSTVIALDELSLLGINRKRFHQFVEEMPSLSIKIMEVLSLRLRDTDEARASTFVTEQRLEHQVLSLETEKQRLEELERLRKETTDLIIHDLRNPLSAINLSLNTLTLVLPDNFPQANRQLLEVAKMSVDHMKQLVDSLLGVSRIESGEEEFIFTNTDLASLIQEVAGRFTLLGMKKISLWQQIESRAAASSPGRRKNFTGAGEPARQRLPLHAGKWPHLYRSQAPRRSRFTSASPMLASASQSINANESSRVSLKSTSRILPGAALDSAWPTAAWQLKPMVAESGSRMVLTVAAAVSFLLYPCSQTGYHPFSGF